MPDDQTYSSNLAEFVDKSVHRWARQKKQFIEPKLKRNFQAVTNRDFREKTWKKGEGEGWRSTTWIGFVRTKVWSFYSVMSDTVLKAGKIPYSLEPSPYQSEPMSSDMEADRDNRIEKMTKLIDHQMQQRKADREYMKKWLSGAYYGMAFSKFNVETISSTEFREIEMDIGPAAQYMAPEELAQYRRFEIVRTGEDVPGYIYVSAWNMVWDMEAENLQDGQGYAEHIPSSAYDLRKLIGKPGYIEKAIKRVIAAKRHSDGNNSDKDGPAETPGIAALNDRRQKFTRYESYMLVPRKYVEEFEEKVSMGGDFEVPHLGYSEEDEEESGNDVEVIVELCDREIIRLIRNDTGRRNHNMWVVELNLDESTGTGIADNMEDVQTSLVGMIRAFEDNKKLSANVTTVLKSRYFNNPDQLNDIVPGKKYDIADGCNDVRKAIMPLVYPDVGESLMSGINLMMSLKDDVSMIPTIMQGFNLPKHAPDTAYEMRELKEGAGKYIGQAIRNDDEQFIEPEIRGIYEYNMLYGEDESCKVNAKVCPNGFTSFQNKEIRGERMKQALALFLSNEILEPYAKVKPHLDVIYESMDEDPDKFINSEEEMAEIAQRRADAQAEAERKALLMEQQKAQAEFDLKMRENQQKHEHELESNAQEHEHQIIEDEQNHLDELEEIVLDAKLSSIYKKPETSVNPQGVYGNQ